MRKYSKTLPNAQKNYIDIVKQTSTKRFHLPAVIVGKLNKQPR